MAPAKSDRIYAGVLQNGLCTIFSRSATSVRPAHVRTIQSRTRYGLPASGTRSVQVYVLPTSRTTEWVTRSGRTLAQVIRLLPECCTSVTSKQAATCSLMVMQEICDNEEVAFEGGQYACTEEELYEKAIALLEKCRIETRRSGQKLPEPTVETPPTIV